MTDRAKYWGQMVAAWESSGLTQAEFCRRRGLTAVTFAWWKCRLVGVTGRGGRGRGRSRGARRPASAGQNKPSFVEVALPGDVWADGSKSSPPAHGFQSSPPAGGSRSSVAPMSPSVASVSDGVGYEVALPCGTSIRLPADFDVDRASQLILALITDDQAVARSC